LYIQIFKNMKKALIILTLVIFAGFSFAGIDGNGTGEAAPVVKAITLSGKVIDFNSGEVLTGVEVTIEGTNIVTYTDFDGIFEIKDVKPGTYSLVASLISYKDSLVENLKADSNANHVDIKLQASN
jgi:hypothetical protein